MQPARKVDLRRPRPQAVPATSTVSREPRLPLEPGQIVRSLTNRERVTLTDLGIDPAGGPLPSGLAKVIAQVRQEAAAEKGRPNDAVAPGHRLDPPEEMSLADVAPEKAKSIRDWVASYRREVEQRNEIQALQIPGAGPGVNEAIAAAAGGDPVRFIDDLPKPPDGKIAVPGSIDPGVAAVRGLADRVRQAAAPQPQPPPPEIGEAGGLPALTNCPHCNWDLSLRDGLKVGDADKTQYLVSTLLQGERYRQEVELFAGRLKVGFRTLTSEEADQAYRQVALDTRAAVEKREAPGETTLWGNLLSYRMVMGLDFVDTPAEGRRLTPTLAESGCGDERGPLAAYHEAVVRELLPSENIRRVVGAAYHQFNLAVETMEAHAHDPNFWPPIDGHV